MASELVVFGNTSTAGSKCRAKLGLHQPLKSESVAVFQSRSAGDLTCRAFAVILSRGEVAVRRGEAAGM
jgi:hypothetical protein